ncbi:hypothetical protein [Marinobacter sp. ANT_B65]|uniref:hypothetical protein n=1 Tax=Marinobacter sp. ANT_B65 TaxID=2039467 RepID=UPI000BBE5AD6|nr:hypothetical protein [Marinobacter sp. ANT_B65]PCM45858.1 hypothetical protein CPA50_07815 [Marinobacter sp. ANT_B65]
MLSKSERENLYDLIVAIIGEDATVRLYKNSFNERTLDVVEDMLSADSKCNANMKKLILDLSKGGGFVAKGWLRKLLKSNNKALKKIDLKGYGCQVSVKSRWKTAIINSAI